MSLIKSGVLLGRAVLLMFFFSPLAYSQGQEATIRKNLSERIPQMPKIEEISRAPINGLYEVRVEDNEIYYTDAEGNYLIQGQIIDTKSRRNLTEDRLDKLNSIDFNALAWKDAIPIVKGNGKRKLAVFADPNCGYCKRFERDLQRIDNITVYLFLYPVLGPDSVEKARNIWCAKDKAQAWLDQMLRDRSPSYAQCDTSAIGRNTDFGKKHRIQGTPTLIASDGTRVPGAIGSTQIEKLISEAH
jgi:thiol:disulfide interchange protein DsbC